LKHDGMDGPQHGLPHGMGQQHVPHTLPQQTGLNAL
jgi:hypothetical protein